MKTNISKTLIFVAFAFFICVAAVFFAAGTRVFTTQAQTPTESENRVETAFIEYKLSDSECLTDAKRAEIQLQLQKNIHALRNANKLVEAQSSLPPMFIFPVRGNGAASADPGVHGISNFVDQNLSFPNQLLDYNCGARTYDTAAGYNHKGIDIFTYPFGWRKMDNSEAAVTAAADGQIIYKSDGNFDRSCALNNNNWNAVYLRHADSTVSWYGHLKNGSPTSKPVGATVVQGEYLGIVGSSGNSTGPHLHFEIYNSANQLQDPYQGTCNSMNAAGYWLAQPAYRDSKINKLMTHSAPPVFQACPNPEIPNEKNVFAPGGQIIVAAYYRDYVAGQVTQFSLVQPDGAVAQSWSSSGSSTFSAAYSYFTRTLPANAPVGTWKFRSVYNSQTYEHSFRVGQSQPFDYDADGRADVSVFRPSNGAWYLNRSSAGYTGFGFGLGTDRLAPADFDADGRTDVAVFRDGNWYIIESATSQFRAVQFGAAGDVPVPADYDADGRADVAVFRPSNGTWYLLRSSAGYAGTQFGSSEDKPVAADYDGDGRADIAVFRPSNGTWYIVRSSQGFIGTQFGQSGDRSVQADYDGDGRTDIAVFRPANGAWYLLRSTAGYTGYGFGLGTDTPAPADYDGDGRADVAVFRDGNWYIINSQSNQFQAVQFGASGDKPTPASFLP